MVTAVWPSAAVENTCFFSEGMEVLRSIKRVNLPPKVSIPSERGVTSTSNNSDLLPRRSCAPWIAAPIATTSSGFTPRWPSLPKISLTNHWILGMRVIPPTMTTSSISDGFILASARARTTGPRHFSIKGSTNCSNLARVIAICKCLGPVASAVINGRLISVVVCWERSFLARSAASLRRCNAIWSLRRSMPFSFLNSSAMWSITTWSKSSPPRWVSPLVDSTLKIPSPTSRMEISKVPPPRSNTAIFSLAFLSMP